MSVVRIQFKEGIEVNGKIGTSLSPLQIDIDEKEAKQQIECGNAFYVDPNMVHSLNIDEIDELKQMVKNQSLAIEKLENELAELNRQFLEKIKENEQLKKSIAEAKRGK